MKTLYSILIFLSLSFSSFGKDLVHSDTVRTSVTLQKTFKGLMAEAVENSDASSLSSVLSDTMVLVMEIDKVTITKIIPREIFISSFQSLLFDYARGQASLEQGNKDGFQIYVLRLSREDLDTSTLIFVLSQGKVIEIYFF